MPWKDKAKKAAYERERRQRPEVHARNAGYMQEYRRTHPEYVLAGLRQQRVSRKTPGIKTRLALRMREYRHKNPDTIRAIERRRYEKQMTDATLKSRRRLWGAISNAKLKREVFEHYGGVPSHCACCGETCPEFLAIDHINGGGAAHRRELGNKTGMNFYRYLRQLGFPAGYRVLCHNCNSARGIYGQCPHEREWASVKGA